MLTTADLSINEFYLIRDFIEKKCGVYLTEEKMYLIITRLTPLMIENECNSFGDLYYKAAADSSSRMSDKIIEAITTHETYWLRDESPFVILEDELLKKFSAEIEAGKRSKIRIWCAACSTGQEPYSIAMTVLEFLQKQRSLKPEHVEILATDISSTVLYLAMAGRYDSLAMSRGLPANLISRYFKKDGKVWVIDNEVKKMIRYQKLNLRENFNHIEKQDVIFCRNVLIYFSDEFKKDILRRIGINLRPNGYLFLGASESVYNFTHEYKLCQHSMGLYYEFKQNKE